MALATSTLSLHSLSSQVGGHPGVLASEDNSLIIKPCLPRELDFYRLIASGHTKTLEVLQEFIPKFYGTLDLQGRIQVGDKNGDEDLNLGKLEPVGGVEAEQKDEYLCSCVSIVLENIAASFTKPNVLDVKLGTVLYDDDASLEKKKHMDEVARNTTSAETGVRLTGFQVYDNTSMTYVTTPKAYGKSIKPAQLPEGLRKFFPSPAAATLSTQKSETPNMPPQPQSCIPLEYLLAIVQGLLSDIKEMRDALRTLEIRMVASSFLIIYEGDIEAIRNAEVNSSTSGSDTRGVDGDDDGNENEEDNVESDSDSDSEDRTSPVYAVKMIDFAHTRLVPGQGPDLGVLKGVDTVVQLLEGRLKELEVEVDQS